MISNSHDSESKSWLLLGSNNESIVESKSESDNGSEVLFGSDGRIEVLFGSGNETEVLLRSGIFDLEHGGGFCLGQVNS